jgi:Rho-binding antiterminator
MTEKTPEYRPISCDFHDLLETLATQRKLVQIRYRDNTGAAQQRTAVITDVFSRGGAEYVSISTGDTVRLNHLVEIGTDKLADY